MVGALKVRVGPNTWATIGGSSHIGEATVADGDHGDIEVSESGQVFRVVARNTEAHNIRVGGAHHYTVEAGSKLGWFDEHGDFFLGKNLVANHESEDGGEMCPDFLFDQRALRLYLGNISLGMIADPADINARRWGPDQAGFPYGGRVEDPPGSGIYRPVDGTFADLTGLGSGSLIGQLRSTPAAVPFGVALVSNKALTGNVATLTTTATHSFKVGQGIVISGVDATFDGVHTITSVNPPAPNSTSFTYAKVATDVASVASGGKASNNQDTPGGQAQNSNVVLSMRCADDMPRIVTGPSDPQVSVAGAFEVNICAQNSHDFRNTMLRMNGMNGETKLGIKACAQGDVGALLAIRAHEGSNARQSVIMTGTPTGGTFKIRFYPLPVDNESFSVGELTANLPFNVTALNVQNQLLALPGIPPGSVVCSGGPLSSANPIVIDFVGDAPLVYDSGGVATGGGLGGRAMFRMKVMESALTGGEGTGPNGNPPKVEVIRGLGGTSPVGINHEKNKLLVDLMHAPGGIGADANAPLADYLRVRDGGGFNVMVLRPDKTLALAGAAEIGGTLDHNGSNAGFFGSAPVNKPTGVTPAAALTSLGLGASLVEPATIKVFNARTASYTLALADLGKAVTVDSATAVNLQVPANASVPFVIGSMVDVIQLGVGQVTVIIGGSAVVNTSSPTKKLRAQYSVAHLIKTGTDTWVLHGDLATS